MRLTFSLSFALLLIYGSASAQVFRSTPPPPPPPDPTVATPAKPPSYPLLVLDTTFLDWSEEQLNLLKAEEHSVQQISFPDQRYGRLYHNGDQLAVAMVRFLFENGQSAGSELHLRLLDNTGALLDSLVISYDKGISLVGLSGDESFFYLAYQKSIDSGNRYMHVAKVDRKAQLIWETNLGQRFGTDGLHLLRSAPDGRIVLFSQMYQQVGFDFINAAGQFTERKLLHFYQDFSPKSFFFKPDGKVVGIGTYTEYEGRNTKTSSVVFELGTAYQLLRYQQIQSPYNDVAQDIMMDKQGNYYFLVNAEKTQAPYGQRPNFMTIGKLDQNFELLSLTNIENTETGLSLGLSLHPQKGVLAYQRFWNKGLSFVLFQLNERLELENILSMQGRFGPPQQMVLKNDQLHLMMESRNSQVISFPLE